MEQLSTDNSKKRGGLINEFLWSCAGVNKPILRQCPSDYSKYAGIGGMILFTAIMAAISGGYALYFVFKDYSIATMFGVFWGLLIFNLDRFIVNTMYSDGKHTISWAEIRSGLPRIIMAIFLGLVISTPLEMKIFSDQIDSQLLVNNGNRIKIAKNAYGDKHKEMAKYEKQLGSLTTKREELDIKVQRASEDLKSEVEGTALSGKVGRGPIYEGKERFLEECRAERKRWEAANKSTIEHIQNEINQVKNEIKKQDAQITKDSNQNGFAARYEAFENVTNWSEHTDLAIVALMITLLFVIIETAPTFLKMMMEDGPYDSLLRAEKHKTKVLADKRISDANDEVNTAVRISTMKNEKRLEAETLANQDILEKIARAQAELLETAITKWKEIELEKVRENPSDYITSSMTSTAENGESANTSAEVSSDDA